MSEREKADYAVGAVETFTRHFAVVRALKDDTIQIRSHLPEGGIEHETAEIFTKENAARLATILENVDPRGSKRDAWYMGGAFFRPSEVGQLAELLRQAVAYEP